MAMFHHSEGWCVTGDQEAIDALYIKITRLDFLEKVVKGVKHAHESLDWAMKSLLASANQ